MAGVLAHLPVMGGRFKKHPDQRGVMGSPMVLIRVCATLCMVREIDKYQFNKITYIKQNQRQKWLLSFLQLSYVINQTKNGFCLLCMIKKSYANLIILTTLKLTRSCEEIF